MSEDYYYLCLLYVIFGLTLFGFTIGSTNKLKTAGVNLIIAAVYSGLLLYQLRFSSTVRSGFSDVYFLILVLGLHSLINIIATVMLLARKLKQ